MEQRMSALDNLVLKLTTYLPGGMEWKPDLHPRDHNGKFVLKGGGVFNALNDIKSGKYAAGVVTGTPGHHFGVNPDVPEVEPGQKIGGVEIHAPTEHGYAPSVHTIDWKLNAGDKVYKVTGGPKSFPNTSQPDQEIHRGQNGVIVHHQDGSATTLMPTPEGEMPKLGLVGTHFSDMQATLEGLGYQIDTDHPLDINTQEEAAKFAAEAAAVEEAKKIGAAPQSAYGDPAASTEKKIGETGPGGNPVAQNLFDEKTGEHIGHIEKTPDGKYTSHDATGKKVGNISKHVHTAVEKVKSGKLTTPTTYQHKKPVKAVAKEEATKATPEPKAHLEDEATTAEPQKKDISDYAGNKIGHIQQDEHGVSAFDHKGNKISGSHKTATAAASAVKKQYADEFNGKAEPVKETPKVTETDTKKPEPTVEHKEPAHLESKKVFQHIHDDNGKHIGHIEKLDNGKFTSHDANGAKVGNISKHLGTAIEKVKSGKLTTPTTYAHKKGVADVSPPEVKVVKDGNKQNILADNGAILGHIEKDETTGKWQSYDQHGNKLGYTISNMKTAIDKVKANVPDQAAVDKALGKTSEPDDGLAEWEKELLAYNIGVKHETTTYEQQMAAVPEVIETIHLPLYGGAVDLLPGQAAYGEKAHGSPWLAIVSDGKVQHIQNPSTGKKIYADATKDSPANGWQHELDSGKLYPVGAEVEPEKAPVTSSVEKKVAAVEKLPGLPEYHGVQLQPGDKVWEPIDPTWGFWIEHPNGMADGYDSSASKVVTAVMPKLQAAEWTNPVSGPPVSTAKTDAKKTGVPVEIWQSATGNQVHLYGDGTAEVFMADGEKAIEALQPVGVAETAAFLQNINPEHGYTKLEVPGGTAVKTSAPKAGAKPKIAKKKAVSDANLPTEITVGEKTYKPTPGTSVWTKEIDGDTKVHVVSGISGKGTIYNQDGSVNVYLGDPSKKVSLASLKKNDWEKIAYGGDKQEIAAPAHKYDPETVDKNYNGEINAYSYAHNAFFKLTNLSSGLYSSNYNAGVDEVGEDAGQYIANLTYIKANPDEFNLDKSDKTKVTKALNLATNIWNLHVITKKIDSPDYVPNNHDKGTLKEVKAYFDKVNSYTGLQSAKYTETLLKNADFKSKMSDLGFDLDHGSHDEFVNYAKNEGASFIGGMEPEDVNNWVHAHLGVPSYHGSNKSTIEAKAAQTLKMKSVAAHATEVLEKKNALAPSKDDKLVDKALTKAHESLYKKISKLESEYEIPGSPWSMTYQDNGTYHVYGPDVQSKGDDDVVGTALFSKEQAIEFLATHPQWKKSSESIPLGSGVQQAVDTLTHSEGYDLETLDEAPTYLLQDLGAAGADLMNPATRKLWLNAHLSGDNIALYNLEKTALKSSGVNTISLDLEHNGSNQSPQGLVAQQSLADHLATLSFWTKHEDPFDLYTWASNHDDAEQLAAHFGLADPYVALGQPVPPANHLATYWVSTHSGLPQPKTAPSVVQDAELTVVDGTKFNVPHGALVTQFGIFASKHEVFTPTGWYVVNKYGDAGELQPYPNGYDHIKAHAFSVADGAKDVTPKWQGAAEHQPLKLALKPNNVSQIAWDLTTGAEAGGKDLANFVGEEIAKASDEDIVNTLNNEYAWNNSATFKLLTAPPSIQKLAAWVSINYTNYNDAAKKNAAQEVYKAINAKLNAGEYVSSETEKFEVGDHSFDMPPGATVYTIQQYGDDLHVAVLSPQTAVVLNTSGSVSSFQSYKIPDVISNGTEVFTSKANLSLDKAHSEGQEFTQAAYDSLAKAEEQPVWNSHHHEPLAAFIFKEAVSNIDGGEKYVPLTNFIHTLPAGVKQLAVHAASKKDTDTLDAILWKYNKGAYALAPVQPEGPKIDPSASYAAHIAKGQTDFEAVDYNWSVTALRDYIKDFGLDTDPHSYSEQLAQAVADHLAANPISKPIPTEQVVAKGLADHASLELHPIDKSYGGMHSKQGYTDIYGQEWMAKGFDSDPNGPFRVDVEHVANLMSKLLGFKAAETFTKTVGGKYSVVQKIVAHDGNLSGYQPNDLHEDQLVAVMQEHVIDWLISNHDTHSENMLRLPGNHAMLGIDKGQAFKHLYDDKLAVGYLPPENGAPVWYDQFYKGVLNGSISQEKADRVAFKVLQKAYYVQTRQDARYRELLEQAMASRTSWPSNLPNKEAFIDAAMERKAHILGQFEKLYKDIYEKAGYTWNIDTENFGKNVGGAHISNGVAYADAVKNSNVLGHALFFNSADLEDGHLIHNTMKQSDGGTALLGSGKIRADADKALTAWLQERVNGKLSHGQAAKVSQIQTPGSQLPQVDQFHSAIVAYSKTVGQHATNGGKEPDGQYNESTVNTAVSQASNLKATLDAVKLFRAKNPDKVFPSISELTTLEQQDAWISAMEQKYGEYLTVAAAHEQNMLVKNIPFKPISYTPTKGLKLHSESAALEKYDVGNGETAVKTNDGGHYVVDASGAKTWVSSQDFGSMTAGKQQLPSDGKVETWTYAGYAGNAVTWTKQQNGAWKHSASGEEWPEADLMEILQAAPSGEWTHEGGVEQHEESQTVEIANKIFEVSHRAANLHSGSLDPKTGKLVETGTSHKKTQTGYEYTIEYGDVRIHYRPWTESGVARSQQGQLHYEVRNWDGGHEAIDDVLNTLQIAGVDLTPADAESLEHFYWSHLTNVIQDRADANSVKHVKIVKAVKEAELAHPNMTTGDRLDALKEAWASSYGKDAVDNTNWYPQFTSQYSEKGGRPHWMRPDVSAAELQKIYGYNLPVHSITGGNAHNILLSGSLIPTEERPRLGIKASGTSSSSDQHHGSAGFVFTRQNLSQSLTAGHGEPLFIVDPSTALRTSTYAFAGDNFGDLDSRKTLAYFDPKQMYKHEGGGNEMMVKHEAPIFAALFQDITSRDAAIAKIKAAGIDNINGRKIEDVVLTQSDWNKTYQARIDKLWEELIEAEKKYTEGGA